MLTTDQKGAVAETAIVLAAVKLGIDVYGPRSDGGRYDMIFDLSSGLARIQCKWANRVGDTVLIRTRSCRRTRTGLLARPYAADEVDFIVAYEITLDRCFVLPPSMFAGRNAVHLRLAPARNNQRIGINWADDFDFAATLRPGKGP
jgi:PD-(D/E)XK endonuclease